MPNGVGVVGAREGDRSPGLLVGLHDADDGAVGAGDHEEGAADDDEDAEADHGDPARPLLELAGAPVVVEPHAAHRLEGEEGAEDGADERDEAVEDRDRARDEVRDDGDASGAAEPGDPVLGRVGREMLGAAEEADEDVLGGQLDYSSVMGPVGGECRGLTWMTSVVVTMRPGRARP